MISPKETILIFWIHKHQKLSTSTKERRANGFAQLSRPAETPRHPASFFFFPPSRTKTRLPPWKEESPKGVLGDLTDLSQLTSDSVQRMQTCESRPRAEQAVTRLEPKGLQTFPLYPVTYRKHIMNRKRCVRDRNTNQKGGGSRIPPAACFPTEVAVSGLKTAWAGDGKESQTRYLTGRRRIWFTSQSFVIACSREAKRFHLLSSHKLSSISWMNICSGRSPRGTSAGRKRCWWQLGSTQRCAMAAGGGLEGVRPAALPLLMQGCKGQPWWCVVYKSPIPLSSLNRASSYPGPNPAHAIVS